MSTGSAQAQAWFDQGLVLTYGYNHEEAIRSYERALELDPDCAMAHWGIAYAAGPHINKPVMDEQASLVAYEHSRRASELARAGGAGDVERDLIEALQARYAWPPPADRAPLERAYADAMRSVWQRHAEDADVGALFAESLMDLRPWDLWTADGQPQPETPEILQTLETVLARQPDHVHANHLYIHAVEASPDPGRALAAADALRTRVPDSGHLAHMPSHIDVRVGHYQQAILANQLAAQADRRYVEWAGRGGGFYAMYRAHTLHFLAWAAMYDGQSALARQAAQDMLAALPDDVVDALPDVLEGFLALPYHVDVRFGDWDAILDAPDPGPDRPTTRAMRHYARGLALSALGRLDEARAERAAFDAAYAAVPETVYIGNNGARTVLDIGRLMLAGELLYREGRHDQAFAVLAEAVARDDALRYDEPWGWMQPARHALGALLLEQGRVAEAEAVYRADLIRHPGNGWALHGLAECLHRLGREAEARQAESDFRAAFARADVAPPGSCYCRRG
ncbi:MAG TPA: tetratricopeptide repeat protein [Planctomycetota bacterium]|nr:tetratricopeptide repeat protein [Planctomycetota bacterium]